MKTTLSLLVLFVLVLGGGYSYSVYQKNQITSTVPSSYTTENPATTTTVQTTSNAPTSPNQPAQNTPTPTAPSYSLAQVSTHNTASNCWSTINGNVYDLSKWVTAHPGGEGAILSICGKDGTPMFSGQHGADQRALSVLAGFKVGTLAQ